MLYRKNNNCDVMKILNSPPSVGLMIRELYISPTGITIEQAAALCQIDTHLFKKIANDEQEIGYELAYKLSKGFNTTLHFWLNLQNDYKAAKEVSE